MNLAANIEIFAYRQESLWDTRLQGFRPSEQKEIRRILGKIPEHLQTHFRRITRDPALQPKHGRYETKGHYIRLNPAVFSSQQRFGSGEHQMSHAELTVAHEVGHSVREHLSPEEWKQWMALSGWKKGAGDGIRYTERRPGWPHETSEWTHEKGAAFTRHYAEKGPDDDWADSFAYYWLGDREKIPDDKRQFLSSFFQRVRRER